MFSVVYSAAQRGKESRIIQIRAKVFEGFPGFSMRSDPALEVLEAQGRVRDALINSGFTMTPKRIVVRLCPEDLRKRGRAYDLPIAIALLAAYRFLEQDTIRKVLMTGELCPDGSILSIPAATGILMEARRAGFSECILPAENAAKCSAKEGIKVCGAKSLREAATFLKGTQDLYASL